MKWSCSNKSDLTSMRYGYQKDTAKKGYMGKNGLQPCAADILKQTKKVVAAKAVARGVVREHALLKIGNKNKIFVSPPPILSRRYGHYRNWYQNLHMSPVF